MPFRRLSVADLETLAAALEGGRLVPPFDRVTLARWLGADRIEPVAEALSDLGGDGLSPARMAWIFRLLAEERRHGQTVADRVELVWTGPESAGSRSRDTGVVVRELFAAAERSVLVSGFTVFRGREVFAELAARMKAVPGLDVRFFLNLARGEARESEPEAVARFVTEFRARHWAGDPVPKVYYDPRALDPDPVLRAVLHAKCVVVDRRRSFVSSANFTEAAQARNIEAGLLVDDPVLAESLTRQFDALVASGALRKAL